MDRTVCHSEVCTSGSKCSKAAEALLSMLTGRGATNEQNVERAQAMILRNCTVTTVETAARPGINVIVLGVQPSSAATTLTRHQWTTAELQCRMSLPACLCAAV
jgi:hypothetical protein